MTRADRLLRAVVADPTEHGLWCDRCALPSVSRFPILWADDATLRIAFRSTVDVCAECWENDDDPR